ncbi:MAG: FAD-dependent oxidoreductase, partial [Actinomycetota bacterium]|nr:FAD-dependent oxidoreductase [Actinomycetota bacterium]
MPDIALSRRTVLAAAAILGAFLALPKGSPAQARTPDFSDLPFNPDETRSVAIVGSGVSGLTAAYVAARAGFRVVVLESDDRYGGRSLTVRPADPEYRNWWFDQYNPHRLFSRMYVSGYHERSDSPVPQEQTADFVVENWPGTDEPVELFLNAGPGRIPSNHTALLDLCGEVGVRLEPYVFLSGSNLLSSETYKDGKPVQWRAINYSLMGELATVMSQAVSDGLILKGYEEKKVQAMLTQFGNLQSNGTVNGSDTVGYVQEPGGWQSTIETGTPVSLEEILDSDFTGVGDLETSAGSFLFNPNYINWQPTLMQPIGGMDRIWQQLLLQQVPAQSLGYEGTGIPAP